MVIFMKKIMFLVLSLTILLCGCEKVNKREKKEKVSQQKEIVETIPEYQDLNHTPIAFYQLKGNTLEKVTSITGNFNSMDVLGLLQVYPSNEQTISLTHNFGTSFYNTWQNYNSLNHLKIGFFLNIPIQGKDSIPYTILYPSQTMDHWEYFMVYLYDDYTNRGKSFYSHIKTNEYTDNTLFTAFKLQCGGSCLEIAFPVSLTVFTYDSEDDLIDGIYRGNSSYTIPICNQGSC